MAWTTNRVKQRRVFLALIVSVAGCGDRSPHELAPISGGVIVDGEPFCWGSVQLSPVASGGSIEGGKTGFGMLDEQGRFVISTYGEADGAVVGRHRVTLNRVDDGPNGPAPAGVPSFRRYLLPGDAFEVVAGQENELRIELTSKEIRKQGVR